MTMRTPLEELLERLHRSMLVSMVSASNRNYAAATLSIDDCRLLLDAHEDDICVAEQRCVCGRSRREHPWGGGKLHCPRFALSATSR